MVKMFVEKYLANPKYLMNLTLEITSNCNLKCCHCYVENRAQKQMSRFLDFEMIKKVICEAYDMNAVTITLTGGEPMTHPNFNDIIEFIKSKGFVVFLKTNGTLISNNNIKYIKNI